MARLRETWNFAGDAPLAVVGGCRRPTATPAASASSSISRIHPRAASSCPLSGQPARAFIALAKQLGRQDCASVLQETLEEEKATDAKLTTIAESRVNKQAV
ncbi:DUF892 family protein [Pseudoroseomonas sp. WGS1072]|uniref:DUF892 family protein n=1 Tax=Roseomonas sp. WGS1072 TaxID=3366816 RepID=UPI003BF297E2